MTSSIFAGWSPIAFVAPHDELAAALPAGKLKRPGADGTIVELAHFFRRRLLHDHPAVDILESGGVGALERDDEGYNHRAASISLTFSRLGACRLALSVRIRLKEAMTSRLVKGVPS